MDKPAKSITEIFDEGTPIDEAIAESVREALLEHKRAGNPVCEWRDGKVVWVQPEDINLDDFDNPPKSPSDQS